MIGTITHILAKAGYKAMNGPLADERRRIAGAGWYGYRMYCFCTFNMTDDNETLNFAFPTPPVTVGDTTYSTAYDVALWMGNTNGFGGQDEEDAY